MELSERTCFIYVRATESCNEVLDDLGLVILKDENGKYVARGNRNIKINGENIKPLLAEAAMAQENVTVLERVNITDYIIEENEVKGAWGFNIEENVSMISEQSYSLCNWRSSRALPSEQSRIFKT